MECQIYGYNINIPPIHKLCIQLEDTILTQHKTQFMHLYLCQKQKKEHTSDIIKAERGILHQELL